MCCLGFFGFLRISELTYLANSPEAADFLTSADLTWSPGQLTVLLRRSKGDPLKLGVRITIGGNGSPVCALKAVQHYLNLRGTYFPNSDLASSPLFLDKGGSAITKSTFSRRLAELAAAVGVEGKVTPHSLRIGAATAAWRAGFSDSQIQSLGRWKSRAFMRYLRMDADSIARLNARLGDVL
jgi:integrase